LFKNASATVGSAHVDSRRLFSNVRAEALAAGAGEDRTQPALPRTREGPGENLQVTRPNGELGSEKKILAAAGAEPRRESLLENPSATGSLDNANSRRLSPNIKAGAPAAGISDSGTGAPERRSNDAPAVIPLTSTSLACRNVVNAVARACTSGCMLTTPMTGARSYEPRRVARRVGAARHHGRAAAVRQPVCHAKRASDARPDQVYPPAQTRPLACLRVKQQCALADKALTLLQRLKC
jgi:hypothetical protein